MNHLGLDIANQLRSNSKVMDGANQAAFLEMQGVIKHTLNTKIIGLTIELNKNKKDSWNIIYFGYSNYGEEPVQKSVSGFLLYLLGVRVS